ncbi:MAG: undecaprenyl-diphosphate phosphatase [bacterium]
MENFKILFLGLIQGLTEFLPVSSSAHLVFVQDLLNISEKGIILEVFVHFGTLLSIIIVFFPDLKNIFLSCIKKEKYGLSMLFFILIGSIPAGLIGILFSDFLEKIFNSTLCTSLLLIITGFILFLTKFLKNNANNANITWKNALIIGVSQAIAILPGISRSGITISTGLFCKLKKELAYKFSFLLSIPAILGATFLKLPDIFTDKISDFKILPILGATFISFIVGYFSLRYLLHLVKNSKLYYFSYYCWIISIFMLLKEFIKF